MDRLADAIFDGVHVGGSVVELVGSADEIFNLSVERFRMIVIDGGNPSVVLLGVGIAAQDSSVVVVNDRRDLLPQDRLPDGSLLLGQALESFLSIQDDLVGDLFDLGIEPGVGFRLLGGEALKRDVRLLNRGGDLI